MARTGRGGSSPLQRMRGRPRAPFSWRGVSSRDDAPAPHDRGRPRPGGPGRRRRRRRPARLYRDAGCRHRDRRDRDRAPCIPGRLGRGRPRDRRAAGATRSRGHALPERERLPLGRRRAAADRAPARPRTRRGPRDRELRLLALRRRPVRRRQGRRVEPGGARPRRRDGHGSRADRRGLRSRMGVFRDGRRPSGPTAPSRWWTAARS